MPSQPTKRAAEKRAAEKPATKKAATKKAATKKAAKTTGTKPASKKPATKKPATKKPATKKPAAAKPHRAKPEPRAAKPKTTTRDSGEGGRRRSRLWRWRRPLFFLALLGLLAMATGGYALSRIPLPETDPLLQTTFVCAADVSTDCSRENSLAQLSGGEDRVSVTWEQVPPVLIDAVLAAEDRDFFEHNGVDPIGIVRAAWTNLKSQDVVQGGSSITQQYVKTAFLSDERTLRRKVEEAVLAIKLERELTKEQILLRYLNTIYFGRGAYGVQAASRAYFGKDVEQVGLAEAAYLAALIRAPESADALRGTDDARARDERRVAQDRRSQVLGAMVQEEMITQQEADAADAVPFDPPHLLPRAQGSNFGVVRDAPYGTEYFVEYVRRFLVDAGFTDAEIYGGGLRVYTTLDYDLQRTAFNAVTTNLTEPDDPSAALVATDRDGYVRAMVGGTDWSASQVNLAAGAEGGGSGRGPGSSFKPFVLAAALQQGISAKSFFPSPATITIPGANAGGPWEVDNYDDADFGDIDLIEATQVSSNTVYAQLIDEVGPANVADLAQRMGVSTPLDPVHSLVLGSEEVSVIDMATAYGTLARGGERIDPIVVTRVEDAEGNVLRTYQPERQRVLDELTTQTVNWVLSQVIQDGTGRGAAISQPAAGKTGTTEEYRDAWFVGYTCELTAAVWVGFDEPNDDGSPRLMTSVHGEPVTGGSIPADIWRAFMEPAARRYESCAIPQPYTFGGTVLNPELATTTTTETTETSTTTGSTTTTEPPETTTTAPPDTETTLPPSTPTTGGGTTSVPPTTAPP
jgi:penicillin-binding protein 1A